MFPLQTYKNRRAELKKKIKSGLILLPGNSESPMNYAANFYRFRQDSTFLYYFGLSIPDFAAVIDVDENKEIIFGNDFSIDDIVWMGPQPKVKALAEKVGVKETYPLAELNKICSAALKGGRKIHFIPQYRHQNMMALSPMLGIIPARVNEYASMELNRAVCSQRAIKTSEEIAEIEKAIAISYEMHTAAMKFTKAGMIEREIAGFVAGLALSLGSGTAFPIIFSRHGETLHNTTQNNKLKDGDIVVHDSGAESEMHYASDITRTFPVSGKFTAIQKDIYEIVLSMQLSAIDAIKPGVAYKSVHLKAAKVAVEGLKAFGFMKGNANDAVEAGAHAMFFPHGVGHLLGLDVHDLENYGENNFGYDDKIKRSGQFGLNYLRYAKTLVAGNILTVEPGLYFIPQLIEMWKKEKKHINFINYDMVLKHKNFSGIRIEDNVLVTPKGRRVLGKPIPKTVEEVEEVASAKM